MASGAGEGDAAAGGDSTLATHLRRYSDPDSRVFVRFGSLAEQSWVRLAVVAEEIYRPDIKARVWVPRLSQKCVVSCMKSSELVDYLSEMNWALSGDPLNHVKDFVLFQEHLELARARAYFLVKYVTFEENLAEHHMLESGKKRDGLLATTNPYFFFECCTLLSEMDLALSEPLPYMAAEPFDPTELHEFVASCVANVSDHVFVGFRRVFEIELRVTAADRRIYSKIMPESKRPKSIPMLAARATPLLEGTPLSVTAAFTHTVVDDPVKLSYDAAFAYISSSFIDVVQTRDVDHPGPVILRHLSRYFVKMDGGCWLCTSLIHAFRELRNRMSGPTLRVYEPRPDEAGEVYDLSEYDRFLHLKATC